MGYSRLVAWILLLQQVWCGPALVYKTTNVECESVPEYSANATCHVKAINWNKAVAHMDVDLVKPLRNVSVRLQIYKKDYTNKYQPFLVNVFVLLCDVLAKRSYAAYGIILRNVLKKYTNINHTCPFEGHIIARDLYVEESLLPVSPLGFYKVVLTFFENSSNVSNELAGIIRLYVEAKDEVYPRRKKPSVNKMK